MCCNTTIDRHPLQLALSNPPPCYRNQPLLSLPTALMWCARDMPVSSCRYTISTTVGSDAPVILIAS